MQKRIIHLLAGVLLLTVTACGTVATPEWAAEDDHAEETAAEDEGTAVAEADTTEEAETEEPTEETEPVAEATKEPTATTEPTDRPTATPEPTDPPTATTEPTDPPTATPEPTDEPTPEPTAEEATEDATEETEDTAAAAEGDFEQLVADAIAAGNPEAGQTVFNTSYDTSSGPWMCASCHSVDESQVRLVGPGLWNLHERAAERIEESGDANPVEYVRNSILNTGAYIVPADEGGPYPENLMPANYGEVLTDEELTNLVAYLLTLGNENAGG